VSTSETQLADQVEDDYDQRDPTRNTRTQPQPKPAQCDYRPPEEKDPAPRREVNDEDLTRVDRVVVIPDDREQPLEEVDRASDHQQGGKVDPITAEPTSLPEEQLPPGPMPKRV